MYVPLLSTNITHNVLLYITLHANISHFSRFAIVLQVHKMMYQTIPQPLHTMYFQSIPIGCRATLLPALAPLLLLSHLTCGALLSPISIGGCLPCHLLHTAQHPALPTTLQPTLPSNAQASLKKKRTPSYIATNAAATTS